MVFFNKHKETEYSDEELLILYRNRNDISYFSMLYERYIPLVYGLCLKYLKNTELSQDAVMDIFEKLAGKIHKYEIKVFKTWLYSVVKYHCFHTLKSSSKEMTVDFNPQIMESDNVFSLLDEDGYDESKEQALNYCLGKLPESQKISVTKFYFEDKSYADIVEDTGYTLKNVKSYIQNGKRNLKMCIERVLEE